MRSPAPALAAIGLTKRYGDRLVLDGASIELTPGEVVAVLGSSGAGKTTLFRCLTRLAEPDAGEIVVDGKPMHALRGRRLAAARRNIGLVFQHHNLIHRLSALDNVLAGRLGHAPLWRVALRAFERGDRQLALAALDRVGLLDHAQQRADTLSGGQRQRVAIARVLAQRSRIVLADEPVASLDADTAHAVMALLRDIARERGIAILCSLHQPDLAARYGDRLLRLAAGRLEEIAPATTSAAAAEADGTTERAEAFTMPLQRRVRSFTLR
jgi:phosphonate transport system ATP-binding protein